jgi:imidazolonepropionase-like amidohydrolase
MTRTVFAGGTVFDAAGGTFAGADVVVEDGRVLEVGRGLDGDERVDVTGRTLLPGLFDCHVHMTASHIDMMRTLQTPFSYRFFATAANLRRTLAAGITTVRDAGGSDLGIKQAQADGLAPGPRLFISLTMLSQTGGHGDSWMPCGSVVEVFSREYPGMPTHIVDGPGEMRRKVRELIRNGADVIKVATSGGVLSPRDDPRHAHFQPDELDVLVSEATAAGRFVMAHAQATDGIKNAIRAGIRSIEHGIYLDDEAVAMMVERGTWLVPTLVAPHGVITAAEQGAAIPEASVRKAHEVVEAHEASFRLAVEAGVNIAMGTDSPISPHGANLNELPLMVKGGLGPEQALQATTLHAARLIGVADELGSLEPGKRADIVVVDGDPLDFATLADRVDAVYQDGTRVI